jgi:hypothetical protein
LGRLFPFYRGRRDARLNLEDNCALQHICYARIKVQFTTVWAVRCRALAKSLLHCNISEAGARDSPKRPAAGVRDRDGAMPEQRQETECLNP